MFVVAALGSNLHHSLLLFLLLLLMPRGAKASTAPIHSKSNPIQSKTSAGHSDDIAAPDSHVAPPALQLVKTRNKY
jgi:hypothetical protein